MAFTAPAYLALSRHGIFYFRMTVPSAVRPVFGAREVKRSLKTPHRQTAIRLARVCAVHCEHLFVRLQEHRMTYREMRALLQDAKDQLLGQLKQRLVQEGPPGSL